MATTAPVAEERTVSVGTILSRAFGVMGDNPLAIFGLSFLLCALPQLIYSLTIQTQMFYLASDMATSVTLSIGAFVIYLMLSMLAQGAMVRAAIAFSRGERASIGDCLKVGLAVAFPLVGLSLLAILGIMAAMLLFLIPGFILLVMWAVVVPALVNERTGIFEAFSRSRYLTKGARWKVFGMEMVLIVIIWMVAAVLGVLMVTLGGSILTAGIGTLSFMFMLISAAANTFTAALWSTAQTSLYISLRNWKEGPQSDDLADVFA